MSLFERLIAFTLPAVPRPIVGYFSRPYIAGPALADAVRVVKELNAEGVCATMDILGEHVTTEADAREAGRQYLEALQGIVDSGIDSNVSIKLSQMGLKLDVALCRDIVAKILALARDNGMFVRIDMEDSSCTTDTIDLYLALREEYDNVGVVIQSMLRRSLADVARLAPLKTNFRLCKGIYIEPRRIAWRDPQSVNSNYALLLEEMLQQGCYAGIATHDEKLVWEALRIIHQLGLSKDRFEFQMLLGVDQELRRLLVAGGYRVRVYVPYGRHWYAYSVRRLKENPRIAGYVMKAFLGRT